MSAPTPKSSASVEYNGMEFLTALMLKFSDFTDFESLCEKIKIVYTDFDTYKQYIVFNPNPSDPTSEMNEFRSYVNDIGKKKKFVNDYIQNFRELFSSNNAFTYEQIERVFISGKLNHHDEIAELNKDVSKIDAKADVYVKLNTGKIVGISVKQSRDATKSNYSVQKMLGEDCDTELTQIRKKFLSDCGYPTFEKEQRSVVNELFYPQNTNNPYWQTLKNMIEERKSYIIQKITEPLLCSNVPYDMYEYDGESFHYLNKQVELSLVTFEEHLPYYHDSKGNLRNAAKLFYKLTIGEKVYRVEVRWKGNIHNSSPQFQLHEDH